MINSICEVFMMEIFNTENTEELINSLEKLLLNKKIVNNENANKEARKVVNSLIIIWEFLKI